MTDDSTQPGTSAERIRSDLTELARLLRDGETLDAQTQQSLGRLLEELSAELHPEAMPSGQTVHLAQLVGTLAQALHEQHEQRLKASREALAEAAMKAESQATATGIVGRLIDVLSGIGI